MDWSDFAGVGDFISHIERLERRYVDDVFYQLHSNGGNLQSWYNDANKVKETWVGKMSPSPTAQSASWSQVGEIVIVGLINRCFPEWFPLGVPIGSETRLGSNDAVIHIDVKSHKEGDQDIDVAQDVRPEQISGDGDYLGKLAGVPAANSKVRDLEGDLGSEAPKLPPYYDFGPNMVKICITMFAICIYEFNVDTQFQSLRRLQLVTVPNGLLRWHSDYRDCFRAGKDGRSAHRVRVKLPELAAHESWRWRELRFEPHAVIVAR